MQCPPCVENYKNRCFKEVAVLKLGTLRLFIQHLKKDGNEFYRFKKQENFIDLKKHI